MRPALSRDDGDDRARRCAPRPVARTGGAEALLARWRAGGAIIEP
jgi:hypothetical protein